MYRFRNINALLDGFHELENQEIYFATPGELNDPMEGYRDIIWSGDHIVWENMLNHYLRTVERIYFLLILLGESKPIVMDDLPEYPLSPTDLHKRLFEDIRKLFFQNNFISSLPGTLSKRSNPLRRDELTTYIRLIHPYAINAVSQVYYKEGLAVKPFFQVDMKTLEDSFLKRNVFKLVNMLEKKKSSKVKNLAQTLFSVGNHILEDTYLAKLYQTSDFEIHSNKFFFLTELPQNFVARLEVLMFPDWYSASFLKNCSNSAVWAHYGDNHKGACLIFKEKMEDNKTVIELETEYGYSNGPTIGMRSHFFREVEYHNRHVEIDFFRSLGRTNRILLNALWYKDAKGNFSPCGSHLNGTETGWHDQYWANFFKGATVKLKEWAYEEEYRLIIHGSFTDYTAPNARKLKYDFHSLEGIIFGMNTSVADKIRIIRIIEQKCRQAGRTDFCFYQAHYSHESGLIDKHKISGLSFAPTE